MQKPRGHPENKACRAIPAPPSAIPAQQAVRKPSPPLFFAIPARSLPLAWTGAGIQHPGIRGRGVKNPRTCHTPPFLRKQESSASRARYAHIAAPGGLRLS